MVELLLDHGADLSAPCSAGKTALHYAAEVGVSADIMQRLSDAHQPEQKGSPGLLLALHRKDRRQRIPLHYAACQGSWSNVNLLLQVDYYQRAHAVISSAGSKCCSQEYSLAWHELLSRHTCQFKIVFAI